jgi:LysM repeat protein
MYSFPMDRFPYMIQPGDNFWLLAQRFHIPVHDIVAANPEVDPYYLFVGQVIHIPFEPHPMPVSRPGSAQHQNAYECVSKPEVDLKSVMRMLWD